MLRPLPFSLPQRWQRPALSVALLLVLFLANTGLIHAQYSDQSSLLIAGTAVSRGDAAFADFNGDDRLDLIVTGQLAGLTPSAKVYVRGVVGFNSVLGLPLIMSLSNSRLDVGDFNNDGTVDIAICGDNGLARTTRVIRVTTPGGLLTFQEEPAASGLTGVNNGDIAWGDYDNDGDLDLVLVGNTGSGVIAKIYENQVPQGGTFIEDVAASATLVGMDSASVAWIDYNQDGLVDLVTTGRNGSGQHVSYLFQNAGNSQFVNIPGASFQGMANGFVDVADMNNDGFPDVAMCGKDVFGNRFTHIYLNQTATNAAVPFVLHQSLTGIADGKVLWGDLNNDGWSDLVIAGQNGPTNSSRLTQLYLNNQSGSLVPATSSPTALVNLNNDPALAFGDGDFSPGGKLDLFTSGKASTILTTFNYYNNVNTAINLVPSQPTGLTYSTFGNITQFTWSPSATGFAAGTQQGLSYELYIGTGASTDQSLDPAMAAIPSGKRYLQRITHIQDTTWSIVGLPANPNYFAAVQAVDQAFEGSAFSATIQFPVIGSVSTASVFTNVTSTSFPSTPIGPNLGFVSWCDCDNDGDKDLVYGGNSSVSPTLTNFLNLYTNQGGGNFLFQAGKSATLPRIYQGAVAWGDVDNDGDQDLVVTGLEDVGFAGNPITEVFLNDGTCSFGAPIVLTGVSRSSADWGDVDADGDLDLLVTGKAASGNLTRVYLNSFAQTGVVGFTNSTNTFDGVETGDGKFGDFDGDGDLDFAIIGATSSANLFKIYVNDGNGTFTSPFSIASTGFLRQSNLLWADLENDGAMELVVMGNNSTSSTFTPRLRMFKYYAGFGFLATDLASVGFAEGSIEAGDYNQDGLIDLLITGKSGSNISSFPKSVLLQNQGNGVFTEDPFASADLVNVMGDSEASFADYNNDGRLDVALVGTDGTNRFMRLYRNDHPAPVSTPNPPQNPQDSVLNFDVFLTWDEPLPPAVNPNRINGFTYELYVDGPAAGNEDKRSSGATIANGYRRKVGMGKIKGTGPYRITGLTPGTYTWGVQAIDQDHEGSTFLPGGSFVYQDPSFVSVTSTFFPNNDQVGLSLSAIAWGDYKSDGSLDLVVSGKSNANSFDTRLYQFDTNTQTFLEDPFYSSVIVDVADGDLDWGDFDNDGDLDLVVTGESANGPVTRIYKNISGGFTTIDTLELFPLKASSAQWAHLNRDGFLDLVLIGENAAGTAFTKIYLNNGAGGLVPQTLSLANLTDGDIAIADFDQDGFNDLVLTGSVSSSSGAGSTVAYRNQGNGNFTLVIVPGLANLRRSTLAVGDMNSDGFPDLAISGVNNGGTYQGFVFKNLGGSTWSAPQSILGVADGDMAFADCNNDGYPDLVIAGERSAAPLTRGGVMYKYNSVSGQLVEDPLASPNIPDLSGGASIAWGDIDNDGKIDLLTLGEGPLRRFDLLKNLDPNSTFLPGKPQSLAAQVIGNRVRFSWQAPANVASQPFRKGISYQVSVGSAANTANRLSPMANLTTGYRRIVSFGTPYDTTSFSLQGLPNGTYFWQVQAIDTDMQGGPFETGTSFAYEAPTFQDVTSTSFATLPAGLSEGDLSWADYDLDGDLDLMVSGNAAAGASATLYRNTGGNFAPAPATFTGLTKATVTWVDLDNDNRPDLILTGLNSSNQPATVAYLNKTTGFTSYTSGLPGISEAQLAWADMDRDGDNDLLISGLSSGGAITELYYNNGAGAFTAAGLALQGLYGGSVATPDLDGDLLPDLFVAGRNTAGVWSIKTYRNLGTGSVLETVSGLPASSNIKAAWADYDSDGDPDIALMAGTTTASGRVYLNNGSGSFTLGPSFSGTLLGDLQWGDVDENGRPDLIVIGDNGSGRVVHYHRNTGTTLTSIPVAALPILPVDQPSLAFGDFSGDGKLDLAVTGRSISSPTTRELRLYRNVDPSPNQAPGLPGNLNLTSSGDTLIFTWTAPSGNAVFVNGYSYQLVVGTSANAVNVLSPDANLTNGYRRVVQWGGQQQATTAKLIGLPGATYHWAVQTVDQDYEGSGFATATPLVYQAPLLVQANSLAFSTPPSTGVNRSDVAWADIDGDGKLDLVMAGEGENLGVFLKVYTQKLGKLEEDIAASANLAGLKFASIALADYDLDGDPDLLVCGQPGTATNLRQTRLYRNDNGVFVVVPAINDSLPQVRIGSVAWADVDLDGDPDIAITGESATGLIGAIYLNENGIFVRDRRRQIQAVQEGKLAFGDFDRDGDPDLALAGANGNTFHGIVYRNNPERGEFQALPGTKISMIKTKESALAWVDYNNDGYLDLMVAGETSPTLFQPEVRLYRYNPGSDAFIAVPGLPFTGFRNGDIAWGDINDDGWPDVVVSGKTGATASDRRTALYLGSSTGAFTLHQATTNHLAAADNGSALAMGDFDNDGKLDLALAGQRADAAPRRALQVYRNAEPSPNQTPGLPTGLSSAVSGDTVRLSWVASPAPANLQPGISYNLILQKIGGGTVVSPLSFLPGGLRRLPAYGNAGHSLAITLRNLEAGSYQWRLQAIDQDLEGGAFTSPDTFTYTPASFVNVTRRWIDQALPGMEDGDAAWGDVDGDGDLDLIVTGRTQTQNFFTEFFLNDNQHSLRPQGATAVGLPALRESSVAWHDIDADGDLDLAIAGLGSGGRQTRVFRYQSGSFQAIASTFEAVSLGDLAWIDADHDGDPDLLLTGKGNSGPVLHLYLNNNGVFTRKTTNWPGLEEAALAVVDINRDGFQDFVVAGFDGTNPRVLLFTGDVQGNFAFSDLGNATPIRKASLGWMDFNHDGWMDLALSGTNSSGQPVSERLLNQQNGTFSSATSALDPIGEGQLVPGDVNEDGYGDIIAFGENAGGQAQVRVYVNQNGSSLQSNLALASDFVPVGAGVFLAQGDFDGDGKLDLMVSGGSGNSTSMALYQNQLPVANFQLEAPEQLSRSIVGASVQLEWEAPSGMSAAQRAGLTYAVTLDRVSDGSTRVSGLSTQEGVRQVVAHGAAGQTSSLLLSNLEEGAVYRWKVQAIGQDYEGSPFSAEDAFAFEPPAFEDKTPIVFTNDPPRPVAEARISLGDYDADGDLDLIAVGEAETGMASVSVFRNETTQANGGKFVLDTAVTQALVPVKNPALAWEDVNGDGFLDLFLAGLQNDGTPLSRLYLYQNGNYQQAIGTAFPDLYRAMADWADYDRDGDLDLALAGLRADGSRFTGIFRQTTPGQWELDTEALAGINNAAVVDGDLTWGDFDADGDIDLVIAGTSDIGPVTRVLKNNGQGRFSIGLYSELVPARNSRLAWGDFDNDGDMDLLMTGDNSTQSVFVPYTVVYQYLKGDDRFTEFTNQTFVDLTQGSANWGDFNNDGWLDILVSGKFANNDSSRATRLYRNQGGTSFVEDLTSSGDLVNVDLGAAAWGDYNGDQKLDIFLTGRTGASPSAYTFVLFENIDTVANVTPVQPLDPSSSVLGRDVTLQWDAPNYLPANKRAGLSYNLLLVKLGDSRYLTSPQSDSSNGYRRIVAQGALGANLSRTFRDLDDGDYFWQVQTVDQDFEGSAFTDPIRFSFKSPVPKIISETFPATYEKDGAAVRASVNVEDPNIVDEVLIHYKGIASGNWSVAATTGSGGTFHFDIDQSMVDEMGLEYFFQVIGTFGYDAFSDTGYSYMLYPNGFNVSGLRFGKKYDDYDIVAIPLVLNEPGVDKVIEEYGEYNDRIWRLWHYSGGQLNEYTQSNFSSFEPGKGYWLISKEERSFNSGRGRVVEANDAHPYEMNLVQGYNQIGTPFPFAVSWSDILAANSQEVRDAVEDALAYETAYQGSDRLRYLRGGFVFAHSAVTLRVPVRKNPAVQRGDGWLMPEVFDNPDMSRWLLPFTVSQGEKTFQLGGLGMAPGAQAGRDPLDRMAPPAFGEFVHMTIHHPEYFYEDFTRDVVPTAKSHSWEFEVQANLSDPLLTLSWNPAHLPEGSQRWKLLDRDRQVVIDLQEQSQYLSLNPEGRRRFRLYFGDEAFLAQAIQPERIHLGEAYPNPASEAVSIPVSLPPSAEAYQLRIVILNHLGQEIAVAGEGVWAAGFHEITWNGLDAAGRPVTAGLYLYRLEVRNQDGAAQVGKLRWQ